MNEKHRLTIGLLKLFDLILIVLVFAFTAVYQVEAEHSVSIGHFLSLETKISNFAIFFLALVFCHIVFSLCGLYRSRRLTGRGSEMLDVLRATSINIAFFVALSYVFSIRIITIQFLAVFWALSTVVLAAARLV